MKNNDPGIQSADTRGIANGYASLGPSGLVPTAQLPSGLPPGPHASTHKPGGSDAVRLDELAAPTDVTTLNASTSVHGLLRKLDGSATNFMRGDGAWAVPGTAAHTHAESDVTGLAADLAVKEATANKATANGYASLDGTTKIPIAQIPTGTGSSVVCIGNDSRLSDARTPVAHSPGHAAGGYDPLAIDTLGAATNNTLLNASAISHGLLPRLSGQSKDIFTGDGLWSSFSSLSASVVDDCRENIDDARSFEAQEMT